MSFHCEKQWGQRGVGRDRERSQLSVARVQKIAGQNVACFLSMPCGIELRKLINHPHPDGRTREDA